MIQLTRRSFVAGSAAIPFSLWIDKYARAARRAVLTRYDAYSANGQAMLKIYAAGVKAMKAKPQSDPTGWLFQWYTHWVKGPLSPAMAVNAAKDAEIMRVYPAGGPGSNLAKEMWDTCQAHGMSVFPGEKEDHFLPWHRLYVLFLERIIRKVTSEPTFTLPYWDYTTTSTAIHGVIPPEFRKPGDPDYGSLYVGNRNSGVNAGNPIQANEPVDPLTLDALTDCPYSDFCMDLDGGLHGTVHVLVGDIRNMGKVPYAANDPIFWLHHCNIDRLWASWDAAGRTKPTLSQTFVFADENGNRVTANIKDVLDLTMMDYTYDRFESAPACAEVAPFAVAAAMGKHKQLAVVKAKPIALGAEPVRVALEPLPDQVGAAPVPLTARISGLEPTHQVFLVVKDLRANDQPGVLYHLYLDLPAKATKEQLASHHVGVLNFFHATGDAEHGAKEGADKKGGMVRRFDITKMAKALHSNKLLTDKPTLTIAPTGKPNPDAKPVIGEITVIEQ